MCVCVCVHECLFECMWLCLQAISLMASCVACEAYVPSKPPPVWGGMPCKTCGKKRSEHQASAIAASEAKAPVGRVVDSARNPSNARNPSTATTKRFAEFLLPSGAKRRDLLFRAKTPPGQGKGSLGSQMLSLVMSLLLVATPGCVLSRFHRQGTRRLAHACI